MEGESARPLGELRPGGTVRATVTSHQPWGFTAGLDAYEPVGASLDTIRRGTEPGVARLVRRRLPSVGDTVDLVVGEVRGRHREPWIRIERTAPGTAED
ncbi:MULTISPECIES: hypothetical protein [Streptomyces diastaticus group]|uniref:Uncharacterized protein n=1 Tax=Streptomyces gougerotii TaxID=53448 RepID=A0A8H9LPC8_9ACTN|nr:hypothetical protein [Streptomyces gougerotii]GFH77721.1 hypothetical protein Sgou_23910 [Streptomyces gougerotii]GGU72930.1 hypothetical protein GCM10010227_29170 [Streptomyces gougerotii]